MLYHDSGDLDKALEALQESKRLCEEHGVKFDGDDILQEYLRERKEASAKKAVPVRRARPASALATRP